MKLSKEKTKALLPWFLGFLSIFSLVYYKVVFGGYQLSFTNFMYTVAPWNSLDVDVTGPNLSDVADRFIPGYLSTLKQGLVSLWNSQVSIGSPGDIWLYMYPVNYLYFLPLGLAMFLNSLFQFVLAFTGMYLFLREFSLRKIPCALGGISYTFASALVVWHGWPHSDVAAWAPFLFLLYEKALKNNKIKYWIFQSIVIYFMLVCGMPTYAAYFLYLLGFYILIKTIAIYKTDIKSILKIFIPFGLSVLFAAVASLPYTIELLNTVGENGYNSSRKNMSGLALSFIYLRNSLFPLIRGNLAINANESTLYNGILCIVTLPLTLFGMRRKKQCRFFQISFLVVFLIVYTHVFDVVYQLMPAINTSIKYRNIVLLNFILAVLFAFNMADLFEHFTDYYQLPKIKAMLSLIFVAEAVGFYLLSGYMKNQLKNTKNVYDYHKAILIFCVVLCVLFLYFYIVPFFKKKNLLLKALPVVLLLLCGCDSGLFAQEYLPMIAKDAETIPAATDTISYLQQNTADYERYIAIGDWTLFPQSNMYYGINDIRSHSLMINTNSDLKEYFKAMYPDAYENTGTRLAIKHIEDIQNYNLLKYLGCKYILYCQTDAIKSSEQVPTTDGDYSYPVCAFGDIYGDIQVSQDFYATNDLFDSVSVRLANYGKTITSQELLHITLTDVKTNKLVQSREIPLSEIIDDAYVELVFAPIKNSAGRQYRLTLSSDSEDASCAITAWTYGADVYAGDLTSDTTYENDLVIRKTYIPDESLCKEYIGEDGLISIALNDYSERVTLIDNVICADDETILSSMQKSYEKHTLFLNSENTNLMTSYQPLDATETAQIVSYDNDKVTIKATTQTGRYLLLNDYYNKDWSVYVDGQKQELVKANYLMRAVYIPDAGEHEIQFCYEPQLLYKLFALTGIAFLLMLLLGMIHKPLERLIKLKQ